MAILNPERCNNLHNVVHLDCFSIRFFGFIMYLRKKIINISLIRKHAPRTTLMYKCRSMLATGLKGKCHPVTWWGCTRSAMKRVRIVEHDITDTSLLQSVMIRWRTFCENYSSITFFAMWLSAAPLYEFNMESCLVMTALIVRRGREGTNLELNVGWRKRRGVLISNIDLIREMSETHKRQSNCLRSIKSQQLSRLWASCSDTHAEDVLTCGTHMHGEQIVHNQHIECLNIEVC